MSVTASEWKEEENPPVKQETQAKNAQKIPNMQSIKAFLRMQ